MIRLTVACLLAATLVGQARADSPDPKSLAIPPEELSRARELVQQLGSEQYSEREKAELDLAKMGRLARPALLEGANTDPNQEVRSRCAVLLPKATALEIKARIDVFLADTEGRYEHDLPGWHQFRSTIRNEWTLFGHEIWSDRSLDKAARAAFAELIVSPVNRHIMMAAAGPKEELGSIASARRQELYSQKFPRPVVIGGRLVQPSIVRRDPTVEDIATLLFVETLVPSRLAPRTASITNLITASGFGGAANTTGDQGKVYRALAAAWIDSRTDPVEMYQVMSVAGNMGLAENGCRLGIRLLTMPGALGTYRGLAATNLARLGKKEHIPLVEKALADTTVAYTIRENVVGRPINERQVHEVQVRDMALAVSVILSGQKLEDYGFVDNFRTTGAVAGAGYTYSRYYIPEAERDKMHKKWRDWRTKNP
jgi:hypothetical protein